MPVLLGFRYEPAVSRLNQIAAISRQHGLRCGSLLIAFGAADPMFWLGIGLAMAAALLLLSAATWWMALPAGRAPR